MKALTLTQPWATLVAIGAKRIETRSWSSAYRGPLAIHAAKAFPPDARDALCYPTFRKALRDEPLTLPTACVLATCTLVDIVRTEHVATRYPELCTPQELEFGNYDPFRFAWVLSDMTRLKKPIPARGALSLWDWDEEVLRRANAVNPTQRDCPEEPQQKEEWQRREDFGPNGDATTPGFFKAPQQKEGGGL